MNLRGAIILSFFLAINCQAQLSVDKMIFSIPNDDSPPVVNVEVYNIDEASDFRVEVNSIRMVNPGEKNEIGIKEGALLVSPKQFTIPANSQRTIRLLLKERPKNSEEVYRVQFLPKISENQKEIKNKKKSAVNIKVLFGIGLLVFAEPEKINRIFSWTSNNGMGELTNLGNVHAMVDKIEACDSEIKNCADLNIGKRLYAGQKMQFPWHNPQALKVYLDQVEGGQELELLGALGEKTY